MKDVRWACFETMKASIRLEQKLGGYVRVSCAVPWKDRFALIRRNYRIKQKMVDAGFDSWFHADPYEVGDWPSLFTPIENSLWWDIRNNRLALWPQFPVGRYFVDFGNPVAKVAIECDGKDFHQDKAKDAARDADLAQLGWTVFRIPGWQCHGAAPEYDPDMNEFELEERQRFIDERTPALTIKKVARILEACAC